MHLPVTTYLTPDQGQEAGGIGARPRTATAWSRDPTATGTARAVRACVLLLLLLLLLLRAARDAHRRKRCLRTRARAKHARQKADWFQVC